MMIKKQSQIKVNLSPKLKSILKKKADSVGLPMAAYLKYAGLNWYPELRVSVAVEREVKKYMSGKEKAYGPKKGENLSEFFDRMDR